MSPPRKAPKRKAPKRKAPKRRSSKKSTALARRDEQSLALLDIEIQHAAELAGDARSPRTRSAYETDLAQWEAYARARKLEVFPIAEAHLAAYIAFMDKKGLAVATIRRRCTALAQWHRAGGLLPPTDSVKIRELMKGLARRRKTPPKKKRALSGAMVRKMLDYVEPDAPSATRDRVLLLVGLITGMRRSELATMVWADVIEDPLGVTVRIPHSKTDQEGRGSVVGIPYTPEGYLCPATELLAWRDDQSPSPSDRVFGCCAKTINRVVKRYAARIGLDPSEFGGHSFRSGFSTEAALGGATLLEIMRQSRHRSQEVAKGYVQQAQVMENRATQVVLERLQESE